MKRFKGYASAVPNTIYKYRESKEAHILDQLIHKGSYKLYCDDCTNKLKELPSDSVDLVVTDPPYKYGSFNGQVSHKLPKNLQKNHKLLARITDGFDIPTVIDQLVRVLKHINMYIWCSNNQVYPLLNYVMSNYRCHYTILSWYKENTKHGNSYANDEYCLYFYDDNATKSGMAINKDGNYTTPENQYEEAYFHHPTIKPIFILRNLIINSSKQGDTVLDPFVGSGSTGVASTMINRNFIGIDKVPDCINESKNRISKPISYSEGTIHYEINFTDSFTQHDGKIADQRIIGRLLGNQKAKLLYRIKHEKQQLSLFDHIKVMPKESAKDKHNRNIKIAKLHLADPNKWTYDALHHKYWWISLATISRVCVRFKKRNSAKRKTHQTKQLKLPDTTDQKPKIKNKNHSRRSIPVKIKNNIMYLRQNTDLTYAKIGKRFGMTRNSISSIVNTMKHKYGDNKKYTKLA